MSEIKILSDFSVRETENSVVGTLTVSFADFPRTQLSYGYIGKTYIELDDNIGDFDLARLNLAVELVQMNPDVAREAEAKAKVMSNKNNPFVLIDVSKVLK